MMFEHTLARDGVQPVKTKTDGGGRDDADRRRRQRRHRQTATAETARPVRFREAAMCGEVRVEVQKHGAARCVCSVRGIVCGIVSGPDPGRMVERGSDRPFGRVLPETCAQPGITPMCAPNGSACGLYSQR